MKEFQLEIGNRTKLSHGVGMVLMAVVVIFLLLASSSGLANANIGSATGEKQNASVFVVSPPQLLINSIEYLEHNPGVYQISNSTHIVSDKRAIDIYDSYNASSVTIYTISSAINNYRYRLVYIQSQYPTFNVTTIFLNSTNGYYYNITNYLGQITGVYGVSTTNETNAALNVMGYENFALAKIYYQNYVDAITPPPHGGYDIWFAYNHTTETDYGGHEWQEWLNVTIFWMENSDGTSATFIAAWFNNTAEADAYYTNSYGEEYFLGEVQLNIAVYPVPNYGLSEAASAYNSSINSKLWFFYTWNTFEENNNPLGKGIWENDTFIYASDNIPIGPPTFDTMVSVPSNNL